MKTTLSGRSNCATTGIWNEIIALFECQILYTFMVMSILDVHRALSSLHLRFVQTIYIIVIIIVSGSICG